MLSRIRGLTFTSMAHFLNDGTFLIFPLLIVYYEEIHVSDVILGTVAVLYTLLSGILSPFIGDFADKSEKDSLLIMTGILLEGIAMVSFAVSFRTLTYPLMMLGAILLGIGQAFYHPIGGSILSNLFGKSSGRALGINGSAGSVGRSLMPSLVSFLILLFTAIYGLLIYGVIMIVGAVVIRLGLEGYSKATRLRKPKEKLERQFVRFIILLGVMVFLRSMFITGVTTFTGKYVFSIYHSAFLAGIFLTIGFIGSIFGQPFFGFLTEKRGGKFSFILSSVMSLIFFVIFLYLKQFYISAIIYTFFTFSAFSSFPVLLGYVSQVFPKTFVTVANSYVWGIGVTVGGALGNAVVTAFLAYNIPLSTSFIVLMVLAFLSLVMTPLLPKKV
ncbi:MFS transporter [Sulfuracidifex tepidarius]|uniref:Major facilitator superfamily (MFS) profile domain-containing protein n=1 Tax=Sulfuracidifex tepidarius TaxID=1294262 RepID=A0A510DZK1_9CREN|nr:MFS transporter [Sulfuracidifex tepidarius]BBG22914.1 hypothetical protein IC006_0198 [Sulfuracidifex tepidarius]BBG25674.1 hypothetical protein IC007_0179 [Sulfuracidifex tepidarius]